MSAATTNKIGVIGAGSWGTALANLLATKGYPVDLWCMEEEVAQSIGQDRENKVFLPGCALSGNLRPTTDLQKAAHGKDLVLMVVPSEWFRETAHAIKGDISTGGVVVSATKGIEVGTRMTMSAILCEEFPEIPPSHVCALSGPSFAKEVALQLPTAVTVACLDSEVARGVQQVFASPAFRVYTHNDVIGVELGGAVKNVMAIAAGIADGLGLGANTRAALITRGLAEIRRLGVALGALPRTFTGLAGVGDLVLTCTTDMSRNHTVGQRIGQGEKLDDILASMRMVAEGVRNSKSVYNLAVAAGVEMPIVEQTYQMLYEGRDPKEAIFLLMTRRLKDELDEV